MENQVKICVVCHEYVHEDSIAVVFARPANSFIEAYGIMMNDMVILMEEEHVEKMNLISSFDEYENELYIAHIGETNRYYTMCVEHE